MTDREKLIEPIDLVELIDDARKATKKEEFSCGLARKFFIAEYLISHGVTVQQWIPVSERPPEKSGKYLVCTNRGKVYQTKFYSYPEDKGGHWGQKDNGKSITHWMPLPEPPKEEI